MEQYVYVEEGCGFLTLLLLDKDTIADLVRVIDVKTHTNREVVGFRPRPLLSEPLLLPRSLLPLLVDDFLFCPPWSARLNPLPSIVSTTKIAKCPDLSAYGVVDPKTRLFLTFCLYRPPSFCDCVLSPPGRHDWTLGGVGFRRES